MDERISFGMRLFWGLAIAGFIVGLFGLLDRVIYGHLNAHYGSYVPWGLWIVAYIYLIGLSAGSFLVSALVYVFRIKRLEKIGRLALLAAFSTLVGALLAIWMDLGHMERAWRLILHSSFRSVMGWMVWLYSAYMVLIVVEMWFATRADLAAWSKLAGFRGSLCRFLTFGSRDISPEALRSDARTVRVLAAIGIPLAIAFAGSVGAIFGVVGARPYWNSGLTPILFLVGGSLSGSALLTFLSSVWAPNRGSTENRETVILLGRITLGLLVLYTLLEWAEYSIGLWIAVPAESASLKLVLFGPYWPVFWIVHLVIGVLLPAALLVFRPRSVWSVATAGALIALTFVSVRLNIVIPGLAIPELKGLESAFSGPGLSFSYFPALTEWLLFIWTISMSGLIFLLAGKLLPIIGGSEAKGGVR